MAIKLLTSDVQHGAKVKTCNQEDRDNQVVNNGVCVQRGVKVKTCNHQGCGNQVVERSLRIPAKPSICTTICSYEVIIFMHSIIFNEELLCVFIHG